MRITTIIMKNLVTNAGEKRGFGEMDSSAKRIADVGLYHVFDISMHIMASHMQAQCHAYMHTCNTVILRHAYMQCSESESGAWTSVQTILLLSKPCRTDMCGMFVL